MIMILLTLCVNIGCKSNWIGPLIGLRTRHFPRYYLPRPEGSGY